MSNSLYEFGKAEFLRGNIDLINDTIGIALVGETTGTAYTYSSTHQDYADVTGFANAEIQNNRAADYTQQTTNELGTKTVDDDGTFDAADFTFDTVTGNQIDSIVIFKDTGTDATSTLIAYIDSATGLTDGLTPNGGDITIAWDAVNGIFKL